MCLHLQGEQWGMRLSRLLIAGTCLVWVNLVLQTIGIDTVRLLCLSKIGELTVEKYVNSFQVRLQEFAPICEFDIILSMQSLSYY